MSDLRQRLIDRIEGDRDALVEFLSRFTAIPSPNPPGDTVAATQFVVDFLKEKSLPHRVIAAQAHLPNVVGSFEGARPGRHLVLNGHIDVFPAEPAGWSHGPWSGDVADGRIWGRGTVDMKAGTAASIFTYAYLHEVRDRLAGRLTLTAVSDEETGGKWGTRYLLENFPDEFLGDAILNAEPSSPYSVRFGEKGTLRLTFTVKTKGAHGAYPHLSKSATKIAAKLMGDLERLEALEPNAPDNVMRALDTPEVRAAINAGLGEGAADILQRVTVNIGVVEGGLKVNVLPGDCRMEVDVRLPVGLEKARVMDEIQTILNDYPEVTVAEQAAASNPASWSDPAGELLRIIQDNAEAVTGIRPAPTTSLGATDCKHFRYRNVECYVYGPPPDGMGTTDECVRIDDFINVVKTHVLSAYDYLSRA